MTSFTKKKLFFPFFSFAFLTFNPIQKQWQGEKNTHNNRGEMPLLEDMRDISIFFLEF